MEFASKFVFLTEEDEYETISDEELEQGMHVSGSESDEELVLPTAGNGRKAKQRKKKAHHWMQKDGTGHVTQQKTLQTQVQPPETTITKSQCRRADTNVVSVNFNTLIQPHQTQAGDPVRCHGCGAILSQISQVNNSSKEWTCEFCRQLVSNVEPEEIPASEDVTYLVEPAKTTTSSTLSGVDQSLVIFCVDISGSMCVSTEVAGKVRLKGTTQLKRMQSFSEGSVSQFLPSQRNHNVSYISRLQAVQMAVNQQLEQMSLEHPDRRVALVTFNNEVTIVGDGTQEEVTVAGEKLTDRAQLCLIGSKIELPMAVRGSKQVLSSKVDNLEEGGATALGPALVIAVNMAAHHPGSKVILCTDGKANVGLGKLEEGNDEQTGLDFYTDVADIAREKSVTVSVITIGGTDCKLVHLGLLSDRTGGQVNIVDSLKLAEQFGNILADQVIATQVKATFILHQELFVIDEKDPSSQESRAVRDIGNVQRNSTITFEFARRQLKKDSQPISEEQEASIDSPPHPPPPPPPPPPQAAASSSGYVNLTDLPFQLQIEYTDIEGNKSVRVITRSMPITRDRVVAEQSANLSVLGTHAAKKSAELALHGQFSRSRNVALMNQRLAWRCSHSELASDTDRKKYRQIYGQIKTIENVVHKKLKQEVMDFGHSRSDSESSEDEAGPEARHLMGAPCEMLLERSGSRCDPTRQLKGKVATKFRKMHLKRSSDIDDNMANMIYRFRSVGANEIDHLTITDKSEADKKTSNSHEDVRQTRKHKTDDKTPGSHDSRTHSQQ